MRLVDFAVCDDIRFEKGNKISLMGIYNDSINLETPEPSLIPWPISVKLGFFIRLLNESSQKLSGIVPFSFEIFSSEKKSIAKVEGQIGCDPASNLVTLALIVPSITIEKPGALNFELKINDSFYQLSAFDVRLRKV